ncbi:hypothetical protein XENORESO_009104 [Xenotaenia resolanae]|uniref:Uncharacterized protein n=1 Tax=Xenotaenia resolanae TaxID=208358 RepID=A0ABV0WFM5_9TELE
MWIMRCNVVYFSSRLLAPENFTALGWTRNKTFVPLETAQHWQKHAQRDTLTCTMRSEAQNNIPVQQHFNIFASMSMKFQVFQRKVVKFWEEWMQICLNDTYSLIHSLKLQTTAFITSLPFLRVPKAAAIYNSTEQLTPMVGRYVEKMQAGDKNSNDLLCSC